MSSGPTGRPRSSCLVAAIALAAGYAEAWAAPGGRAPLVAIGPAEDDARKTIAIAASGAVYEPDGAGAWLHRLPSTTAGTLTQAVRSRATGDAVAVWASGDGAIYKLAGNGWSAIRLVQRGKAILGAGTRPVAAVGRQLFALDQLTRGEPTKLALAPGSVVALAAGATAIVVVTEAGAWRFAARGGAPVALPAMPPASMHPRLVSERWVIADHGAVDLTTGALTRWPSDLAIGVAAAGPGDGLVAIGTSTAGLELVQLRRGTLSREPIGIAAAPGVVAVGVAVDRAGRALVALSDGRIALRGPSGWSTSQVSEASAAEHPGPPPARSG